MQYRITRQSCGHTMECVTRKHFNSARMQLRFQVVDMLDANGLRDRPVAHNMMRTVARISRDVQSATIALDEYASVTFEVIGG